uniref:Uncharacterized protein n=1 Tax=Anguilla anguilla TaxID=7936 RepID=A0A0E9PMQ7_ANGAN
MGSHRGRLQTQG